jgi:hypothetical protein
LDRQQWPRERRQGRLARAGPSRALKDNRIFVGPARHRRLGKRAHGPKDSEAWGVASRVRAGTSVALSKITGFKLALQGGAYLEKDSWPEDSEAGESNQVPEHPRD